MNCFFKHCCMQQNEMLKQSCSLDRKNDVSQTCLYHFSVSNIVERKGTLCGVEIKSSWLELQLTSRPLPQHYLAHINEYKRMLATLSVRLEQDSNISQHNKQLFLAVERIFLLDSEVIKALLGLATALRRLEMTLVIILNNDGEELSQYTSHIKYLLRDAGVKFCLVCKFDDNLKTVYPFDFLMFDSKSLEVAIEKQQDNEIVDSLFTMRERGFTLILTGIADAAAYSVGLALPFSSFQSVKA
ncbi:hypothetical protein Shal_1279 [Shewanella halifaxensis HAW-EB4]|uniref:EAL domain-containing protein n=2 Tax=Shewanella halifaxensis TaxID=271098 RepID=B0TKP6_SHEHH|nr:hypothetical protein Shal_1279 [Shewanella halifaxensis HAW-EB4]